MWDVNSRAWPRLHSSCDPSLIWTMWDVNLNSKARESKRLRVWSELCGMWTDFVNKVRDVSCEFDLNYVGCELIFSLLTVGSLFSFDLNYVGCEQPSLAPITFKLWSQFDLNYVGCEHVRKSTADTITAVFDLNYVGCERCKVVLPLFLWGRLIWTMWDVNWYRETGQTIRSGMVWSELCGMWTYDRTRWQYRPYPRLIWTMWDVNCWTAQSGLDQGHVWSELCGMWTALVNILSPSTQAFDLNYVGCEQYCDGLAERIVIKFDLNYVGCEQRRSSCHYRAIQVWSELCGMWTHLDCDRLKMRR